MAGENRWGWLVTLSICNHARNTATFATFPTHLGDYFCNSFLLFPLQYLYSPLPTSSFSANYITFISLSKQELSEDTSHSCHCQVYPLTCMVPVCSSLPSLKMMDPCFFEEQPLHFVFYPSFIFLLMDLFALFQQFFLFPSLQHH